MPQESHVHRTAQRTNGSPRRAHGGTLSRGKRKSRRPLSNRGSVHVVLRSESAKGCRALINHSNLIRSVLARAGFRFGVSVHGLAIHFNHVHIHVQGRTRLGVQNFFRVVAGHVAQGILREFPLKGGTTEGVRKFWRDLAFTRIVSTGRDFAAVNEYLRKNRRQVADALGVLAEFDST